MIQGGFLSNTKIKLQNGTQKKICNIIINDILEDGEVVQNIININPTHILIKTVFPETRGFNIIAEIPQEIVKCPFIFFEEIHKLHHIITDLGTFRVHGIQVLDYNSSCPFWNHTDV